MPVQIFSIFKQKKAQPSKGTAPKKEKATRQEKIIRVFQIFRRDVPFRENWQTGGNDEYIGQ